MSSATRFIITAVVVALSVSTLVTGAPTGSTDVRAIVGASAATEAAAEPTEPNEIDELVRTDVLPGVPLALEEMDPGIYRVIDDGAGHDLQTALTGVDAFGSSGEVWVDAGGPGMFRLGGQGSIPAPYPRNALAAALDGTFWSLSLASPVDPKLLQFDGIDGTAVTEQPLPESGLPASSSAIDVTPDGRVWVALSRDPEEPLVAVLEDGEWTILPSIGGVWGPKAHHVCCDMVVQPGGTIWLTDDDVVLRYGRDGWRRAESVLGGGPVKRGLDGTLWALGGSLGRHDGRGWKTWESIIPWDNKVNYGTEGKVAPDGTLWLWFGGHVGTASRALIERGIIPEHRRDAPVCRGEDEVSPGVLSFDGRRWRQYLAGYCVSDLAVAENGSVWVTDHGPQSIHGLGAERTGAGPGLYVITPGAVSVGE